jgi:hypothetical protein
MNPDKIAAFLSGQFVVAGKTLRRPTMGTVLLLETTESPLLLKQLPDLLADGRVTVLQLLAAVAQFIVIHSLPVAELQNIGGDVAKLNRLTTEAADAIDADEALPLAVGINAHLTKLQMTRDWEVTGSGGVPFSPPNGPPSTLPTSASSPAGGSNS